MNPRRIAVSVAIGAVLGVFCIIGVGLRLFAGAYLENLLYLVGVWYNRVLMGLVIGLADGVMIVDKSNRKSTTNAVLRGLLLGITVSVAVFLSDAYQDLMSLVAGFAYGVIIDVVATATDRS
ncbi:MAG: hypothetical protein HXY34_12925 [Candidatus Thorarchaeota archaeon]|nr:hypothetical protein [Candidatus Thorarchaeota archaeon]